MAKTYRVLQYSEQASDNPGIAAGMWAVIETEERPIAFAASQTDACRIMGAFERQPQSK